MKLGSNVMSMNRGRGRSISKILASRPGRGVITTTRSARKIASVMLWVTNTIVFCVSLHRRRSRRFISSRVKASSAPNGSSIRRIAGSWASARTIDARCCMPPESSRGIDASKPARPVSARSFWTRVTSTGRFLISNGNSMFFFRLRQGRRFASWKTIPICSGRGPVTGESSTKICPPVSACSPDIAQRSVVLPQPLGPRMVTNSPSWTSKERSSTPGQARSLPRRFSTRCEQRFGRSAWRSPVGT